MLAEFWQKIHPRRKIDKSPHQYLPTKSLQEEYKPCLGSTHSYRRPHNCNDPNNQVVSLFDQELSIQLRYIKDQECKKYRETIQPWSPQQVCRK